MSKLSENFRYMLGIPKTIYFNFKYFKFKDAIKFPVVVSHKTIFKELKGRIKLEKVKTGMVRIGFNEKENFDFKYNRTIFRNLGEIIFRGKTKIGYGSVISNEGKIIIGENTNLAKVEIICRDEIEIGDRCLFSWNISLMDTDHHNIYLVGNNMVINKSKKIKIGNHIWVGADVKILKGVSIADNNIIGMGSIITQSIEKENVIIGNKVETKILKENIKWKE